MLKKIKDLLAGGDSADMSQKLARREPDLRTIGLFSEVSDEKIAELSHAILYLNELNRLEPDPKNQRPITFYISTYGGNADDMFALYDLMRVVQSETEIWTIGLGKVMSAGVLLLASGTPGHRKIGRNCRVMIHSCNAGNIGDFHNLKNEMEAISNLQEQYTDALVAETSMTKRQLKKLLDRKVNVYLTAQEAIEYGIADEII